MNPWSFVIGFILVDVGIVIGWCLRVGLTRAQEGLPREMSAAHVEARLADYKGTANFIGRWP